MSDTPNDLTLGQPVEETPAPETVTIPVDPEPPVPPTINPDLLKDPNVVAAIEEARRQEKDKVYGRVQTLEERLAEVERERQERLAAEEAARKEAEEAARKAAEEEMSVRELLAKREEEWKNRFNEIEQTVEQERAVFAMERQYQELQQYRAEVIAANDDYLMPELRDLITGNTKEEIDASVALVRDKTSAIVEQMQAQQNQQRQQMRGVPVTAPPVGPLENESSHKTLSADDIAGMDMETYAKMRDKLLQAASGQVRTQGPYSR